MQIHRLDHVTLRTAELERARRFFVDVAGLACGRRPPFLFPGHWLYAGDVAVLHLAGPAPEGALEQYLGERSPSGTGTVDHIAFRCTGLAALEARLRRLGQGYRGRTVPGLAEHQVFVHGPDGLTVEFIFPAHETASWSPRAAGTAAPE